MSQFVPALRQQIGAESDHIVVHGIARTEEQRYRPGFRRIKNLLPCLRMRIQFGVIAALKLLPSDGIVAEPLAQRRAGRNLPQPAIELQRLFLHPAWPEAFGEKAAAVGRSGRVINALQRDHGLRALRTHGFARIAAGGG